MSADIPKYADMVRQAVFDHCKRHNEFRELPLGAVSDLANVAADAATKAIIEHKHAESGIDYARATLAPTND